MVSLSVRGAICALIILCGGVSFAQLTIPSDGSDGALTGSNFTVDLSQAVTGSWDTPSPVPGKGIYDPIKWAVVYKYSSVNLTGGNIYFAPHPSGAPVVWLVNGDVTIGAILHLEGAGEAGLGLAAPGPGGFRGGAGLSVLAPSAGFGPGGGNLVMGTYQTGSGSHGTLGSGLAGALYGSPKIIPLIGGSGGSGAGDRSNGGGGGGGAILIAAKNKITISQYYIACSGGNGVGGFGAGSGGAIKLIANEVVVSPGAALYAQGGNGGGMGRIRIEANTRTLSGTVYPTPSSVGVVQTPQIWPDSTTPLLQIVSVAGTTVPSDPHANLYQPDIELTSGGTKTILVQATNVPVDATWAVQVRMTPRNGKESFATCTYVSGNQGLSTWTCSLNFDAGAAGLVARAYKL